MHGSREQPAGAITIPQSELLHHCDHASLTICGFIALRGWSMIDIIPSGKRQISAECPQG
ncbi:hypothetical protein XH99_34070 [Bradyrhizobium nanningense]|uniref:Uncharacterized protein n=1 Tax=Bradyrhizobium nanningense TaxID=1325118 RepID=A0A4Q0RTY1_9BRAD|nr:hypothetical protein XH99_34070 [Bradyrhizobium nanningense]RXH33809.1 hypothetical protein XH84_07960 [Bradyrhizobium nanningense]TQF28426.1 hypothetical protein UNPA324_01295 [Bradyrhizobium sp. UNPA324]